MPMQPSNMLVDAMKQEGKVLKHKSKFTSTSKLSKAFFLNFNALVLTLGDSI
jgi:hypothetical protein